MIIRWIGACMIIVASAGFALLLALFHRKEVSAVKNLIGALDYMECELQYRLTPLPDLCRLTGGDIQGSVGTVFQKLADELDAQISPDVGSCVTAALSAVPGMPVSVISAFTELGQTLGRFDLPGQLQGFEAVRNSCRSRLAELNGNKTQRLRSYQTLGLCAGAALAILLL